MVMKDCSEVWLDCFLIEWLEPSSEHHHLRDLYFIEANLIIGFFLFYIGNWKITVWFLKPVDGFEIVSKYSKHVLYCVLFWGF